VGNQVAGNWQSFVGAAVAAEVEPARVEVPESWQNSAVGLVVAAALGENLQNSVAGSAAAARPWFVRIQNQRGTRDSDWQEEVGLEKTDHGRVPEVVAPEPVVHQMGPLAAELDFVGVAFAPWLVVVVGAAAGLHEVVAVGQLLRYRRTIVCQHTFGGSKPSTPFGLNYSGEAWLDPPADCTWPSRACSPCHCQWFSSWWLRRR